MAVDLRRVVQNAGRLIQEKGEEEDDVQGVVVRVRGDTNNANVADNEDGF